MESEKKASLGKRRIREKEQLSGFCQETKKLSEERNKTMKKLEMKEQELHFLSLHQSTSEDLELRAIIASKETETKNVKERLAQVERDLSVAKDECERLRMQLQQTTTELAEQSERVRGLERVRANLERERRQVDARIIAQITRHEVNDTITYEYVHVVFKKYIILQV